jgi:thioredoxin 1
MEPTIDAVAKEMEGKVQVVKINAESDPELAQRLGVMSLPTLMVFKGGQPVSQHVGLATKDHVTGLLGSALA